MILDMVEYKEMIKKNNISIFYNGPMWIDEIKNIALVIENRLAVDDISANAAKTIFSVFIEQATNVLMYSAEKTTILHEGKERKEVPSGMLILGNKGAAYFIQTENAVKNENVELIKNRIDHINALDKHELKKYHKELLRADSDISESKGAGIGLVQIARRVTAPIKYDFVPHSEGLSLFVMYVEISRAEKEK